MGPSLPESQTDRNEKADELMKMSGGKDSARGALGVDRKTEFSEVMRQQNPRVGGSPARRSEIQETKRRDSVNDNPSEKLPESEDSVRNERTESKGSNRVRVSGKLDRTAVKAAEKEKAMLKFMDSMESEFSVPPIKIAEALANLKPTDMLKPPEETASQVIQNLGLAPEDQSGAMQLYIGFLQQWNAAQRPDSTDFFVEGQTRGIPGGMEAALLTRAERKQMLSDSLGQMSDKFFLKNNVEQAQFAQSRVEPGFAQTVNRAALSETMLLRPAGGNPGVSFDEAGIPLDAFGDEEAGMNAMGEMKALDSGTMEIPVIERVRPKPMYANLAQNLPSKVNRPSPMIDTMALEQMVRSEQNVDGMQSQRLKPSDFFAGQGLGQSVNAQGTAGLAPQLQDARGIEIGAQNVTPSLMATGLTARNSGFESGANSSEDSSAQGDLSSLESGKDLAEGDRAAADRGLPSTDFFVKPSVLGGAGAVTAGAGKSQAGDLNMQQITNQAQLIVNRGGGEAIVKLNPEGLGEVRLKVVVVNGRVNVEMATQTKEAKQMIESSIGDLRSSLSSHKLSVDHVKVDVGNQAQSDSQQSHRGMDTRPDLGRDQARSFLNQFREDTASRRDPFFEMPGIKAYQARHEPAPIPPASNNRVANRYSGEGRGGRMNLVA